MVHSVETVKPERVPEVFLDAPSRIKDKVPLSYVASIIMSVTNPSLPPVISVAVFSAVIKGALDRWPNSVIPVESSNATEVFFRRLRSRIRRWKRASMPLQWP